MAFKVDGKFFSELTDEKKASFLDTELSFTIYDELDTVTKGQIFRTLNKTTDVNFIEMLNSYGDEVVANFIRETVRKVKQINNNPHDYLSIAIVLKQAKLFTAIYRLIMIV